MKLVQLEGKPVVAPENTAERKVLRDLMVLMRPNLTGAYWDPSEGSSDPFTGEDARGITYVSWEDLDGERQLDRFSICKHEDGHLFLAKWPRPGGVR